MACVVVMLLGVLLLVEVYVVNCEGIVITVISEGFNCCHKSCSNSLICRATTIKHIGRNFSRQIGLWLRLHLGVHLLRG